MVRFAGGHRTEPFGATGRPRGHIRRSAGCAGRRQLRGGGRRLGRLPVLPGPQRRRAAEPAPGSRRRLDRLRVAPRSRRTVVVREPVGCADAGLADGCAGGAPGAGTRLPNRLGHSRSGGAPRRGAGLPGGDPRRRGLPGLRLHAIHGHGLRVAAGFLHRRRRTHLAGPGGLPRGPVGCGGVVVSGTFPEAQWLHCDVQPDQRNPAAGRLAVGTAGFGQRGGREHHDRGPRPQ